MRFSRTSAFIIFCCCSVAKSCLTLRDPVDCSMTGFPVLHYLPELAQTRSIESVMPSNHFILCHPLLLPSIFPSIRVFSNESALRIRWPKYRSFYFYITTDVVSHVWISHGCVHQTAFPEFSAVLCGRMKRAGHQWPWSSHSVYLDSEPAGNAPWFSPSWQGEAAGVYFLPGFWLPPSPSMTPRQCSNPWLCAQPCWCPKNLMAPLTSCSHSCPVRWEKPGVLWNPVLSTRALSSISLRADGVDRPRLSLVFILSGL